MFNPNQNVYSATCTGQCNQTYKTDLLCFYTVARDSYDSSLHIHDTCLVEKHCLGTSSYTQLHCSFVNGIMYKKSSQDFINLLKSNLIIGGDTCCTSKITFVRSGLSFANPVCKDALDHMKTLRETFLRS